MRRGSDSRSLSSGSEREYARPAKHSRGYDDEPRRFTGEDDRPRGDYGDYKRGKMGDAEDSYHRSEGPKGSPLEVFVGGLSWDAKETDLHDLFSDCGHVENIKILMTPEGRSKGAAFILLDNESAVSRALALDGTEHMGRRIKVNRSSDKPPPRRTAGDPNTVFVGNLSYQTTEDDLRDFFKECGDVKDVRLAKDHMDGRPKGFAHVEFMSSEDVSQALKLSGESLNGRDVKVDYAVRKQDSGFRGRRGYDQPRRGSGFSHYDGGRY